MPPGNLIKSVHDNYTPASKFRALISPGIGKFCGLMKTSWTFWAHGFWKSITFWLQVSRDIADGERRVAKMRARKKEKNASSAEKMYIRAASKVYTQTFVR